MRIRREQIEDFFDFILAVAERDVYKIRHFFEKNKNFTLDTVKSFPDIECIAGSLYYTLNELGLTSVLPKSISIYFKISYVNQWKRNEDILKQMISLQQMAKKHSIELTFLKGLVSSQEFFGDISCRSLADIDVLVRKDNLDVAEKMLLRNGFKRTSKIFPNRKFVIEHALSHFQYQRGKMLVEVHWKFQNLPAISFDEAPVWEKRKQILIKDVYFYCLDEENSLLAQILSLFVDLQLFRKLNFKIFIDIYMILIKIYDTTNWEAFLKERKHDGTYYICSHLLYGLLDALKAKEKFPNLVSLIEKDKDSLTSYSPLRLWKSDSLFVYFKNKMGLFRMYNTSFSDVLIWWSLTLPSRFAGYGWADFVRKIGMDK